MKKTTRDYKNIFAQGAELPSPDDVQEQVEKLSLPKREILMSNSSSSKRGRKPLDEPRTPYTTSLSEEYRFLLKYHAMKRGIRPSDFLEEILHTYFANIPKEV